MIHIECEQPSVEWHEARRGKPTASNFGRILTPKTMKLSASADEYIYELIGDLMATPLPERAESYTSKMMLWGIETEEEARRFYAMDTNSTVKKAGFCLSDDKKIGCSPDGLVDGKKRGLELKCVLPKTQARYLLEGVLPDDYKGQVHGSLIVTGYDEWDFMSYCPGMPPFLIRVTPDEYTLKLSKVIYEQFLPRYDELYAKIKERLA